MDETEPRSDGDLHLVAGELIDTSETLLAALSDASGIGFAILDKELRYQAINLCLANINGIPPQAHLGVAVREIFGELSQRIAEPSYHRVLTFGEASQFEVKNAVLPNRLGSRYWGLNFNFPISDRAARVQQIGVLVVDVTPQRKLEEFLCKLAEKPVCRKPLEIYSCARELQDSIEQYHEALAVGLDVLRRPKESSQLLTQSVQQLDQRILGMRAIVSHAAELFPID